MNVNETTTAEAGLQTDAPTGGKYYHRISAGSSTDAEFFVKLSQMFQKDKPKMQRLGELLGLEVLTKGKK
jgi:hypothetical protein